MAVRAARAQVASSSADSHAWVVMGGGFVLRDIRHLPRQADPAWDWTPTLCRCEYEKECRSTTPSICGLLVHARKTRHAWRRRLCTVTACRQYRWQTRGDDGAAGGIRQRNPYGAGSADNELDGANTFSFKVAMRIVQSAS